MKKIFSLLILIYLFQPIYFSQYKHFLIKDLNSNGKIDNNYTSDSIITGDYSKIILGRQQLFGWELFSSSFNIWKTDLDRQPKKILGDNRFDLRKNLNFNYESWKDSSWYWDTNILYMKITTGNPDSCYSSINAVCSGGWRTTSDYFRT